MTTPPTTDRTRDSLLRAARDELAENGEQALSLRAVARRAGLSHAAPGHFFGDRRGLLTAIATDGFDRLSAELSAITARDDRLARLGRAYVDFGADHPALIDLMFRRSDLHADDPDLQRAQRAAIGHLVEAVADVRGDDAEQWTMVSWALVHGLVVLGREGALAPMSPGASRDLDVAHALVGLYASAVTGA